MDIVRVVPTASRTPTKSLSAKSSKQRPRPRSTRSWQAYVDDALLKTGQVSHAAIFGLDGVQWATSTGFQVTKDQVLRLLANITGDPASVRREGIHVGSLSYIFLRSDPGRSIYGRKGADTGVCIVKSKETILIGTYGAGIQPGNCNAVMEKLADYLIQHNL